MTISGVGGTSFDRNPAASMVKKLDTDGSGKLSKAELEKGKAPPGGPSAAELIAKGDQDGDEELSMDELTKLFSELRPQGPPPGPPPGGSPGAGSGGASAAVSASAEATGSDPADANQDGKVSEQERLAYALEKAAAAYTRDPGEAAEASVSVSA